MSETYNGISIDSMSVSDKLSSLQREITKLNELSELLKTKTETMKNSWQGEVADYILEEILKYKDAFDKIKEQNERYVTYVNKVATKYEAQDKSTTATVETNVDSF